MITQCNSDLQMLHYVRNTLGFGRVHVQGETTSRFVVQDLAGLYKLLSILNGNIVLPKRQRQFKAFCNAYNEKAKRNGMPLVQRLDRRPVPTTNDRWTCGFVDREGCFTISF